ncbi:MAG TPA: signal peptide peptidase SppA [Planctomycetaceae bacterium]|nr:signal peptide peptidase SppA [Planctomycetaceae bacterium]
MAKIQADELLAVAQTKPEWGSRPKIALVYGLGECAMDTGIKGRWLERVFLNLAKNKNIRAVVFRVDSPGGDVLASDLVAEALKKCSEKKPVIISQGQVAGSGGYWISMYGDTILAGPNTVTGSIGVIGGWIYDQGFTGKLGLSADHVQRGEHADLLFGPTLPLLGIKIPARNLKPSERAKIERMIKDIYEIFVSKVASGRGMPVKKVKEIAQGHFYSGTRGKQIGLVDKIGGLTTALSIARQKAGIRPDQHIQVIEIPKSKGLFNMNFGLPLVKTQMDDDPVIRYLKMVSQNPYKPLLMLLPGTYPE